MSLETRTKVGVLPDMNWTVYVPSPISTADPVRTDGLLFAKAASELRK